MITIPNLATVADVQRRYRYLANDMKKTGKPIVVLNNGDPDTVFMDIATYNFLSQKMISLEEEYLFIAAKAGLNEFRAGKAIKLKKNQKILDLIN